MISNFVSNTDKDVYVLYNLPEEVIAVIFAYVSRSPHSFRTNLYNLLKNEMSNLEKIPSNSHNMNSISKNISDKTAAFHQKWVLNYGHSSVAEHAVAHIGIERLSRLASAELALATSFNSFTEYSQRYQRLSQGSYYLPSPLKNHPVLLNSFISLQNLIFSTYEKLQKKILDYLIKNEPPKENEQADTKIKRMKIKALEDARYVLTLATHTNLGMTANGRSLRNTLVHLLSTEYLECQDLAKNIEQEVKLIIPTLLRYVKASDYISNSRKKIKSELKKISINTNICSSKQSANFTMLPNYKEVLAQIVSFILMREKNISFSEGKKWSDLQNQEILENIVENMLSSLAAFDNPDQILEHLNYQISFNISEASWHQLLRHNRKINFHAGPPSIHNGYTIPPNIVAAKCTDLFEEVMEASDMVYDRINQWNPYVANYCITNAHNRKIIANCNLWSLYHLINLRTTEEAQWDIRETITSLHEQLQIKHPLLAKYAKRR